MAVKVKSPGSCGELVQGMINGRNFLITCPVDLYSEVEVGHGVSEQPSDRPKTAAAVQKTAEYLGIKSASLAITVRSDLPRGKGMASSSADIGAACQAAALLLGKELSPDEIANIALAIEPTDGVFYSGIMMFDHVHGYIRQWLGVPPPIALAVFDAGGEVDTVSFNQRQELVSLNRAKEVMVRKAVEMVAQGLAKGDCELIGMGATISAQANQPILCKPYLDRFIKVAPRFGAVGVCIAHSGTVLGVMFPPDRACRIDECIEALRLTCHDEVRFMRTVRLVAGGLRYS